MRNVELKEWGGLALYLNSGTDHQMFSILKNPNGIKIAGKNKKGLFDWDAVKAFNLTYDRVLIVNFTKDFRGTNDKMLVVGRINADTWERIRFTVNGEIKTESIGNGDSYESPFELSKTYEWGGLSVGFPHTEPMSKIVFNMDPKTVELHSAVEKSSFPWADIRVIEFEAQGGLMGLLKVDFKDGRNLPVGRVEERNWNRIADLIKGEISAVKR